MGVAAIFGGNRYLVPWGRGIATTSVRTGLAMTALFFKHQFVSMLMKADRLNCCLQAGLGLSPFRFCPCRARSHNRAASWEAARLTLVPQEALNHSARAGGERFFPSRRFRKRWNPVWISRFLIRTDGGKAPLPSRGRIVQSFPYSENSSVFSRDCSWRYCLGVTPVTRLKVFRK